MPHPFSMHRLIIDLPNLPEEGKGFSGEIPESIFELEEDDARPLGPLVYNIFAQRFGSELLLTGTLSCAFEFTCVRTLHPFTQTIHLDSVAIAIEIVEEGQIDASENVREEILLNFPTHPKCEDGDAPQRCEIDPRYLAVDKPIEDEVETPPQAEGDDRWSALDSIKNLDPDR